MGILSILFFATVMVAGWVKPAGVADTSGKATAAKKTEQIRITKGPVIEWVGSRDAVIAWSTNVRSGAALLYGTQKTALSEVAKAPWGESTHRVHLRNLNPDTEYFFVADSGQAHGTGSEATTAEGSFTTVAAGQKGRMYPKGRQ